MATGRKNKSAEIYQPERNVQTVYYADWEAKIALKTIMSAYGINAVANAVKKLRWQHYPGAMLVEVYDVDTAHVYAVLKMDVNGGLHAIFEDYADQRDAQDAQQLERN